MTEPQQAKESEAEPCTISPSLLRACRDFLLLCPFCGGEPVRTDISPCSSAPVIEQLSEDSGGGWRVICYGCKVQTWNGLSREEAIETWNRRGLRRERMNEKAAEVKRTLEDRAREWLTTRRLHQAASAAAHGGRLRDLHAADVPEYVAAFAREVLEEAAKVAEDEVAPDEQRYYLNLSDGTRVRGDDLLAFNTAVCDVGDKVAAAIRQMKEGW